MTSAWVPVSVSGQIGLNFIPSPLVSSFHRIMPPFLPLINSAGASLTFSKGLLSGSLSGEPKFTPPDTVRPLSSTPTAFHSNHTLQITREANTALLSCVTKLEPMQGVSEDFLLCLGRGEGSIDPEWYAQITANISHSFAERGARVHFELWWGLNDGLIPVRGQKWFTKLLRAQEASFDVTSFDLIGAGHDDLLAFAEAKLECLGYTYLDNPEELIQARAKVASRSSTMRSITTASTFHARQQAVTSFPAGVGSDNHVGRNLYIARSHSVPSGLPSTSSITYDTDFAGTLYAVDNVRLCASNPPFTHRHAGSGSMHSGSPDQRFFDDPNGSARQYSPCGSSLMRGVSEPRMSSPSLSDEALYDCDSESTDRSDWENIAEIVRGTSSGVGDENNALPYVLQCYTNWMLETVFEPIRSADLMRRHVIERFMASESRTTLVSIANVVRSIGKSPSLTSDQVSDIGTLHSRVQQTIAIFNANEPHIYEQGTHIATRTLNCALELLPVHLTTSRFSTTVSLLKQTALAFKRVVLEPPGQPINLPSKLVFPNSDVRQYSTLDVLTSLGAGCPMSCPYDVSYANLPLGTLDAFDAADALGLQWMYGCPRQFIILLARMHNIRDNPAYVVGASELGEIESAIRDWQPRFPLPEESYLAIAKLAIYECWRQALIIYLFMGVGGANSGDTCVVRAHKSFMKVVGTVSPSRVPDVFLLLPLFVAAVASHKRKDRNKIYERP
ncbi:hypothetical protein FRC06_011513 [Ceratobasidium sp. 370]|nr:hypothetical protein FRC06_011513 [Ceratobasidium sp. 370]